MDQWAFFSTSGFQINDCFYLIQFNGGAQRWSALSLLGHYFFWAYNQSKRRSKSKKTTHVSHAYGKDFICRFQDNVQKRKQQVLESDLSGHQSDAMF